MGIAGTAMASLAGMLKDGGFNITGSDTACYPPMSDYLAGLDIEVMEGFVASNLDYHPDLVVVGNVIRAIYDEAQALVDSDIPYCSFPQILGHLFLKNAHSVVVAGTHGKTTTTSVAAWLLESAGLQPGFLIGGVARNFNRTASAGRGTHFVIEGDEYDTAFFDKGPKFLHYRPRTCILTSVEFDHADIYTDLEHVKSSFFRLMEILPQDGCLIARTDDPVVAKVSATAQCECWGYGPGQEWDGSIDSVDTQAGTMVFSITRGQKKIGTFESSLVGTHNLYNQVAAAAAAIRQGATVEQLQRGFSTFLGIKRRQEVIGEPRQITVVDDFAHHPTAVKSTIAALKQRFGDRRMWVVWEPRSATSRRNTFQEAYASSFVGADKVVVSLPYDTSSIPEQERFSSESLVADLSRQGVDAKALPNAIAIADFIAEQARPQDVIAIFSNGAFDGLHRRLLGLLATGESQI
ncbi:MAG: UDP-N-acetylmuramate:L-alanyl-gamma-D-glutamyl-meso-diaminopimelate ligase [Proteobacteria bacterium]|nr:UDP-N-acetylmuramate:L-alanyl-gamma-D-glutamyl-meso-diaminopimelate ligase [Pseudomonadota bacterium]